MIEHSGALASYVANELDDLIPSVFCYEPTETPDRSFFIPSSEEEESEENKYEMSLFENIKLWSLFTEAKAVSYREKKFSKEQLDIFWKEKKLTIIKSLQSGDSFEEIFTNIFSRELIFTLRKESFTKN